MRPFLRYLFPSLAATLVVVAGICLEVAFAASNEEHALFAGGWASVLASGFVLWFWMTVVWAGNWIVQNVRLRIVGRVRFARWALIGSAVLITAAAVLAYITSWGIFLQTRRFANWEAIRFTLANTRMMWLHLQAADPSQLAWLTVFTIVLLVGLPLLGTWLARSRWDATAHEGLAVRRTCIWLGLAIGLMAIKIVIGQDTSIHRRVIRLDQLANCLNPVVTLVASGLEAVSAKPIYPCLDVARLRPMDSSVAADSASQTTRDSSSVGRPPSIIIVAVEALRPDTVYLRHQNREVLPHINRLARSDLNLTRAYAQSTHSDYSDVCLVSSLYPLRTRRHHFYRSGDPWPKTLLYDVLKQIGYATAIISSQNESWGAMDQFLTTDGLDLFYHPQTSAAATVLSDRDPGFLREYLAGTLLAGKFPDRHTTDVALEWIEQQAARDRPFCLCMTLQSSHFPYLIPEDAPRPFQPYTLDRDIKFSSYPPAKVPVVRNAYYNGIHECDHQVGRLVEKLRELGRLDDTILVVTGENGEAFHENGEIGHACNPVEPAIRVAAVVHVPRILKPRVDDYPFEHVDLAPTVAHLAGLKSHPNWQGMNVLAENRLPADERLLFFTSTARSLGPTPCCWEAAGNS